MLEPPPAAPRVPPPAPPDRPALAAASKRFTGSSPVSAAAAVGAEVVPGAGDGEAAAGAAGVRPPGAPPRDWACSC